MIALLGWLIDEKATEPHIAEITISSGLVLARNSDDIGFNVMIGSESDLRTNFANIFNLAKLDGIELIWVWHKIDSIRKTG